MLIKRLRLSAFLYIVNLLLYTTLGLDSQCTSGYIRRKIYQKEDIGSKSICCKKVRRNCSPGYYLKKCSGHYEEDECSPCEDGKWLFDETNSTFSIPCEDYSCPLGSKMINYIPRFGCQKPCLCDISRGFYGLDSCSCKVVSRKCEEGTEVTLNGSCIDDSISDPFNDLKPLDWNSIYDSKDDNNTKQPDNQKPLSPNSNWFIKKHNGTIIIIISGVLSVFVGLIAVCKWRLRTTKGVPSKEINDQDVELGNIQESNETILTEVKKLAGISLTLSNEENVGSQNDLLLEHRPVGRASCFIRNEVEHTTNAETVSDPVLPHERALVPSGSRREYTV